MALAASRRGWNQLHSSWVCRADASRSVFAVGPRELHNGQDALFNACTRHIATAALSLRVYSAEGCPLCDGLKEKLEALRERGKFQQDIWSNMQIEAIDVDSDEDLKNKYRMRIPVLELEANGEWKELPFQPPRLTADALGKRLEKHIDDISQ